VLPAHRARLWIKAGPPAVGSSFVKYRGSFADGNRASAGVYMKPDSKGRLCGGWTTANYVAYQPVAKCRIREKWGLPPFRVTINISIINALQGAKRLAVPTFRSPGTSATGCYGEWDGLIRSKSNTYFPCEGLYTSIPFNNLPDGNQVLMSPFRPFRTPNRSALS
jgi:hypothetical protein